MPKVTGTSMATLIERGKIALRAKDSTLATVADAVTVDPRTVTDVDGIRPPLVPFPPLPTVRCISADDKEALDDFISVYGSVDLDTRRTLTTAEVRLLIHEYDVIRQVVKLAHGRAEVLKELARTHLDVEAEEIGIAVPKDHAYVLATPRDTHGHYVLGGVVGLPDEDMAFYRDVFKGSANVSIERLTELYEIGEVSREDYLALTCERRVIDEDKAMKSLERKPELVGIIAKITGRSSIGSRIGFRKRKTI